MGVFPYEFSYDFDMHFIIIPVPLGLQQHGQNANAPSRDKKTSEKDPFDHQRGSNWLHNVAPCRNQTYGEILILTGRLIHSAIT